MLSKILKKVPAASIVVPMFIAAFINSFFPQVLNIGPASGAIATVDGLNSIIAITLVAVGSQLTFDRLKLALHRGFVLFLSKWIAAIVASLIFIKLFGNEGILGITSLAFIAAISNLNNSIFIGIVTDYGDEYDIASAAITAIISVPIFTFITISVLGVANIRPGSIADLVAPLAVGIVLGNIDEKFCDFLAKTQKYIMPFLGFSIGASINLTSIVNGGIEGVILSFLSVGISSIFTLAADRIINKRPGYAGLSLGTSAGNTIAVPSMVAAIDSSWQPYVELASAQLGTVVILTSILVPVIVGAYLKIIKYKN